MKFSWKMFFSCMIVITLAFAFGGFFLISSLFSSMLEREKQAALQENRFLYVSLASDINAMEINDQSGLDLAVAKLQSVLQQSSVSNCYIGDAAVLHLDAQDYAFSLTGGQRGCRLAVDEKNRQYVQVISRLPLSGNQPVFIETVHDISTLYSQRDQFLNIYRFILLFVVFISSVIVFFLSRLLTSPLKRLSLSTRKIAGGDYSVRIRYRGNDEIGRLSYDFNRMTDAVEQNIKELALAAKRQEDFSSSLAHELKTPLTSIIGYADMLRSYDLNPTDRRKAAEYIFSEGKRLEQLSFKLLELIVYSREKFPLSAVNTLTFAQETAAVLKPLLQKYNILLKSDIEEMHVLMDSVLLKTLLYNLADNACKASQPGQTILFCMKKRSDGNCLVSIKDFGTGIPADQLDRITEPFYMVDKSRSRRLNGAGLGLSIAQRIAQLHGAALSVESLPGAGSSFSFILKGGAPL
mgnify:FL=1